MYRLANLLLKTDPDSAIELNALAAEFCEQRKFAAAEACARSAISCAEHLPKASLVLCDAYLWLAEALNGQARHEEALAWAHKAYALADSVPLTLTSSSTAAMTVASTLSALGQARQARAWKERYRLMSGSLHEEARKRRRLPPRDSGDSPSENQE